MSGARSQKGFTLFEVIVVLVITSLISVVLIQGLGLVLTARTSVGNKLLHVERTALTRNMVLEPLRGVVPDYADHPYVFKGTARQIRGLTVHALQEPFGTPTGFTYTLNYYSDRDETAVTYKEEGREPVELDHWPGNFGRFSYRDRSGAWSDIWPINDQVSQTPWIIRIDPGVAESATLVASVAGTHRRIYRLQDTPAGLQTEQSEP
jgi:general secretion pathway protein J